MTARARDSWFKFFPRDWRGDEQLQLCSLAARGLWIELICVAHKSAGLIPVGAQPAKTIARLVNATTAEVRPLLQELLRHGVCTKLDDGTLVSRRMQRDAKWRQTCAQNGSNGGNPLLKPPANTGAIGNGLSQWVNPRSTEVQNPEEEKKRSESPSTTYADVQRARALAMTLERTQRGKR